MNLRLAIIAGLALGWSAQASMGQAQAQTNRLTNTAALFQALGGGWWNRDTGNPPAQRATCKPPPKGARPDTTTAAAR